MNLHFHVYRDGLKIHVVCDWADVEATVYVILYTWAGLSQPLWLFHCRINGNSSSVIIVKDYYQPR